MTTRLPDATVVDIHCHMVPPGFAQAAASGTEWHGVSLSLNDRGGPSWMMNGHRWALVWDSSEDSVAGRIRKMDEIGVDIQVVSLSPALYWYGQLDERASVDMAREVNDSIADLVACDPSRFDGLAHLPLTQPAAAVAELHRAVDELGLLGVALPGNVAGKDWDDQSLFPILEAAAELDTMVFIHPASDVRSFTQRSPYFTVNLIGIPEETTRALAALIFGTVLDRLPTLRVCLAHGGGYGCTALGRFDHAYTYRPECQAPTRTPSSYRDQIWVDSLTHSGESLRFLLDRMGEDRVVLGTDYPADMGQPDPVDWVLSVDGLSTEQQRRVLCDNVLPLIGSRFMARHPQFVA